MSGWPFPRGATVGSLLGQTRGIGPAFDYMRLALALLIFNSHASAIIHGRPPEDLATAAAVPTALAWESWRGPIYLALVPVFFAISGFLVTSSAFRLRKPRTFLVFRALRILPALTLETVLSALVIGPLLTTLPLRDYFGDPGFYRYFLNLTGFITFHLPGLFATNPVPGVVNNSLWTLPAELCAYIATGALMIGSALYDRRLFTALFVAGTAILFATLRIDEAQMVFANLPPVVIAYFFFCGAFLYHWRDRLSLTLPLLVAAGVAAYVLLYLRFTILVAPLVLTYFTVAIGMVWVPDLPLIGRGDYSYGIYLYGFPISQALVAAWPRFTGHPLAFRFAALGITLALAVASWHLLEKPALSLKRRFAPNPRALPPDHLGANATPAARATNS